MKKIITKQMEDWEKEFENLPAVNYNLYIGSGSDACDDCLEYEEALKQLIGFIHSLLSSQKLDLKKKIGEWIEENYQLHGKSYSQSRCLDWNEFIEFLKTL